jgi:hypothetical protein
VLLAAYVAGFVATNRVEHAFRSSLAFLPLALLAGLVAYIALFVAGGGVNRRDRRRLEEAIKKARVWRERRAGSEEPAGESPRADAAVRPNVARPTAPELDAVPE